MTEMEKHAFTRAINTLKALKCEFAIITPTGEKHGDLNVAQQNKKFVRKYKGIYKHIDQYVNTLDVGQETEVPCADFPPSIVQSRTCNWFAKRYGNGSVLTHQKSDNNTISVMRVA